MTFFSKSLLHAKTLKFLPLNIQVGHLLRKTLFLNLHYYCTNLSKIISLFHLPVLEVDPAIPCKLQLFRGSFPREDAPSCLAILEGIFFSKRIPLASLEVPAFKRRLLSRYSSLLNFSFSKFTMHSQRALKDSFKPPQGNFRAISQIHNISCILECLRNVTVYSNSMKHTFCKIGNFVRIYY